MKLNEITPHIIDEMLILHPIKGILTYKKLLKNKRYRGSIVSFHHSKGWFMFDKETLKESERFFGADLKNLPFIIEKTPNGFLYCFSSTNNLFFFKTDRRRCSNPILNTYCISVDFSNRVIKNNHTGFLISKGVEYYVRKFVIPFVNGEMRIGNWEEKYFKHNETL